MSPAVASATEERRAAPETRERILRGTLELIAREGVGGLSNRRIAAEAGVSLGTLTYHFPSQAELLREALELHVVEEVARMEAIAADIRARCPAPEQIAAEVQRLVAESAGRPAQIAELELHLQASRDSALRDASRRCFEAYEGVATAALEALGVPDAADSARGVVALVTGMSLRGQGGGQDVAGLARALVTFVRGAMDSKTEATTQGGKSK